MASHLEIPPSGDSFFPDYIFHFSKPMTYFLITVITTVAAYLWSPFTNSLKHLPLVNPPKLFSRTDARVRKYHLSWLPDIKATDNFIFILAGIAPDLIEEPTTESQDTLAEQTISHDNRLGRDCHPSGRICQRDPKCAQSNILWSNQASMSEVPGNPFQSHKS